MDCPACGEPSPADANWCEACGADLDAAPGPACVACGQSDISSDGYCMSCGHKQPAPRDHVELVAGPAIAISDRGLRHRHNEDAVAMGELDLDGIVLVVCDGVSSTPGSAEASMAAAEVARDLLVERLGPGEGSGAGSASVEAATALGRPATDEVLEAATDVAQAAAAAVAAPDDGRPSALAPSSTFVAAVARPHGVGVELSVVWLGDSRAYWLDDEQATQLTKDHQIEGSLTKWLGADAVGIAPGVAHFTFDGPGLLLVCSDGLWRYAEPSSELSGLVQRLENDHPTTPD